MQQSRFSTFIKLVQKAINQYADKNNWADMEDIISYLKKSDLNIRNYEEAIESIHSGWVEVKKINNKKFVRILKEMQ